VVAPGNGLLCDVVSVGTTGPTLAGLIGLGVAIVYALFIVSVDHLCCRGDVRGTGADIPMVESVSCGQ
jgi:uncharacterized membrane protein YdfJ with MMPL/SSD domain